jgi:hypothetical protein
MSSTITKKPRKVKTNSVVNSPVTTEDDASNPAFDEPVAPTAAPKRYVITKDRVVGMSMEERHKKTEEDLKNIDLSGYTADEIPKIHRFIASLTLDEKKGMLIAADHLGSSCDIVRCNHYQTWVKSTK